MRPKSFVLIFACLIPIAIILVQLQKSITHGASGKIESAGIRSAANRRAVESYGKLPLSFEENQGQTNGEVKFLSRGAGYSLFLTANEAVLELPKPANRKNPQITQMAQIRKSEPEKKEIVSKQSATSVKSADDVVSRMVLVGANPSPQVAGVDQLPGKSNYFIGNDPKKWRTNVSTYAKVRYENVYSGIDLVYYGNQRQLEYDFVVSPGADPGAIRLAFPGRDRKGADSFHIDPQGNLVLGAEGSELRLHKPVVYQEIRGARQSIGGNFVILEATAKEGGGQVGFEIARYDASKPLIIDPVLSYSYSTYLGGNNYDYGQAIAVDSSGSAYVTGHTQSTNFPTTLNAYQTTFSGSYEDVFVTKLNAAGSALEYSTYLGGSSSNGDEGLAIAVDSHGFAYVTGYTGSTDFPTTLSAFQATNGSGGFNDAFVTKLNAAGNGLVYSTYLGGGTYDYGYGIAVDSLGYAYVVGSTHSADFPTTPTGFQQALGSSYAAFVTKINLTGTDLEYSTYLGGTTNSSYGYGIALDSVGNAYVTGYTVATNFPTLNAFQTTPGGSADAFVTKVNSAGNGLIYSTYLGGSGNDDGLAIAVDASGSAYLTGFTHSTTNFPTANAFQAAFGGGTYDAFVTKLDASGSTLVYSTYFGGSAEDEGYGIAVDSSGNAYVTGHSYSTNFPTANAFQGTNGGLADVFVSNLNAAGSALYYSTYLGGSSSDYSNGIAVDASGNAYVTGYAYSTNFPTTANAFQAAHAADSSRADVFVTKVPSGAPPPAAKKRRGQVTSE